MSVILRVALTGGIGSGKSTVATEFRKLGVPVVDSDIISRNIIKPGSQCLKAIINEFGNGILDNECRLNRSKLRDIIFNDDHARKQLENILHPVIFQEINEQVSSIDYQYCLIVVPLLIETQSMDRFDRILLVEVPEKIQIKRASIRDNTNPELIKKIMKSQLSRSARLKYANDIIDNSVNVEELNNSVGKLHKKYMELSS